MKKAYLGILVGIAAGIIDVIPMVLQGLTWDANLSAFSMWVVIGFLISTSGIRLNGPVKGLVMSFIILLPLVFIIGWNNPVILVPIAVMTAILGSLSGFVIEKYGR